MAQAELLRLVPEAPQALRDILEADPNPVQPPIRSEIFGLQRFAQHGRSLGETHRAQIGGSRSATFFPRLRSNIRVLREAHRYIGVEASTGHDVSPAGEWLLDNFHLIEAQLKEIHEGLPRSYFRTLPILLDEPLAGLPRVYGIAWAFVAHTDGAFDEEVLVHFLSAYQETRELNLSEMWAFPTTLRMVLIESLRRLAEGVATNKAAREVANLVSDRIESTSLATLDQILALMNQRGLGRMFLSQMAQRLQDHRVALPSNDQVAYVEWLNQALPDLASVRTQQPLDQAADNLSVSNAVSSLRAIGDADWPDIIARSSSLMRLMLTSRVFESEDMQTRDQTLHAIELLAKRSGKSEMSVGQTLLELMHRGGGGTDSAVEGASHWLGASGRPVLLRALGMKAGAMVSWKAWLLRSALPLYLGTLLLCTLALVLWILLGQERGYTAHDAPPWLLCLAVVLMLFPASETVVAMMNRLISESLRPMHLPRLAFGQGIPPEHRVMVVIPAMLTSTEGAATLAHRLQLHYLANPERNAQFALLTDWADAEAAQVAGDDALLQAAAQRLQELNARYPGGDGAHAPPRFILLHRERKFSQSEQRWIGWERKRGKLEQLVAALAGEAGNGFIDLGETSRMAAGTRYLVTLDSDTQLPPGRLRELTGVAAHPHNQPKLDPTGKLVVDGYGILQPRIVTPLPEPENFTLFHWLFAGQSGIDPYSAASSEVYQDVFGEGTFTGKGLLNVQAVHAVLAHRLPEDHVLSHDLLEGSLARCAAVTNITLIEDAPFHADVAASRVHRWTRGDWQLLPFLLDYKRFGFRGINRWKMFDNLRRSLVAPMSLALMLLALGTAVVSPWVALVLVAAAFLAGPLMGAVAGLSPSRDDIAIRYFYYMASVDLARAAWGGLWHLAQLLDQALSSLDAIGRAVYRMAISKRHLLQWTTAEAAQAQVTTRLGALVLRHWRSSLLALALLAVLLMTGTRTPWLSAVLCGVWAATPIWVWLASRNTSPRIDVELSASQQAYLEGIARDTWRLFERCVVAEDNHLPPDNLQVVPHDMVAHRTSPTNIGLYLLSTACAREFGWIGTQELLSRMEATLETLGKLQRHRGHFLNWYDTQTCLPLLPMYVSTVDSGNLSGHLLAVAQACLRLAQAPHDDACLQRAVEWSQQRLGPLIATRSTLSRSQREQLRWRLADHRAMLRSARMDREASPSQSAASASRLNALAQRCKQLAFEANFSFLYHPKRHLLHIGYRVAEQELDAGYYDLLPSESRLTSLFAVAKGDAPVRHWASLGRLFYAVHARAAMRSWSGSMFEYLMPTLVLEEPRGSVLRGAGLAAVREQIDFGNVHKVPWGVSESAYAASDHTLAYQYAPQGVPRLALRRTPPDELVIAPYATALAAQVAPHRAIANFVALEGRAARGRYGFIEALDFTRARQTGSELFTPVATFMAHHQGMTIVALANVLMDGVARRWGMADTHLEAVSSLLHERAPREVSLLYAPPPGPRSQALRQRTASMLREVVPGEIAVEPTHVLSNGRYSVTLRPNGAGSSRWNQTGITRWRDDALRDSAGSFFYLRRDPKTAPFSTTQRPAPDAKARYRSTFHSDRVCFDAHWTDLQAHTTVWVSPEDDIEFRQIELLNLSDRAIEIELLSAFEITLADPRADEAHPAFSNLFVKAEWHPAHQALMFERRPRLPSEQALKAAHFIAASDTPLLRTRCQTDRLRWLGRNHAASRPLALLDPLPELPQGADEVASQTTTLDTGLDPMCALAVQIRIAPNAKAQLTFATAASDNAETLHAVIDKYRQPSNVQRASLMSATLTGIRLHALRMGPENFGAMQVLTTALMLSLTRVQRASYGTCDRRLLWRFGISGDRPIVLVSAGVVQGMGMVRSLAQALRLWSWGGVLCDLVVVNSEPASYLMPLQHEITALKETHLTEAGARPEPGTTAFHILRSVDLSGDELATLQAQARIHLNADGRPLVHHVLEWSEQHQQALVQRRVAPAATLVAAGGPMQVVPPVGGEFAAGGEFRFDTGAAARPQRPWINVLSNPEFGAQISEAGGGYTWAVNSRLNQLTAWSNDPVGDSPSEWFLLQDRKTMDVWGVAPMGWGDQSLVYHIAHGQGYSTISHSRGDLEVKVTWCVDPLTSIKQVRIHMTNHGLSTQKLRVTGIAEWIMGAGRGDRSTVNTFVHRQRLGVDSSNAPSAASVDRRFTALMCTQIDRSAGFGDGTAFFGLTAPLDELENWTCDRRECFDPKGRLVLPDRFGQRSGSGLDPCAALSTRVILGASESTEQVFLLGYASSPSAARQLATMAAGIPTRQRLQEAKAGWDRLLDATSVKTPDPLFDALVNRWLGYQTIVCRLWAKAGFYQAGGATGFRDQLQDALSLAWSAPSMLREQIVVCASRQFPEGDVQHWWHAPLGAGVRTHFSDDLLWLPYACAQYVKSTGDIDLLDENVAFIEGAAIPPGAEDAYYTPGISTQEASVYEHAARTIDRSLKVGVHGLPLMGSGDWNDGMNRVGIEGRGESVWLGWFLCRVVADFAPLARARADNARAQRWEDAAIGWKSALLGPAWDGQWFKRAFFDNGEPLGTHANAEARIDLIAQAWAVLSDVAPPALQRMALNAVAEHLVDREHGLIRLLDPPLANAVPSAGYIQAYPPGVRENGGQYSHAGVWAVMAQARYATGRPTSAAVRELPYQYFKYLSPAHRTQDPTQGPVYAIEPYVMAGDVYSQAPYAGRGGWSWYTGSAAWMHRAAIESLFGLELQADSLSFTPCLPSEWPHAELTLRREQRTMRFIFLRANVAEALAAATQWDAKPLRPGQLLHWTELDAETRFVIPLLEVAGPQAVRHAATTQP
ncbi:MAG: glucoamylase family protein [Burkholderiaceae bacterium]